MKFFHIADLHLGKMLHHVPLTETDQAFWVERFLEAVDEHRPDAVVVAGDIYDRRVPPVEAVRLFDHFLTQLARRGVYVFLIPGNHDSAVRVAHVNELLSSHRIFIAGELQRELMHITVPGESVESGDASVPGKPGEGIDVTFWLLPYIFPKAVADSRVCGREDLSSYDEAARLLLSQQQIDTSSCNVLVAHQNVLAGGVKPQHSDSETIIGGIGEIEYTAFDAFDYVALGHIHHAQKVGRETVRYAGCPLYYDFSELGRCKDLTMVTIRSKNDIAIERIPITLQHQILQKTGTLSELLEEGAALRDKESYYIQCILQDAHIPPRALEQLREVYGDSLVNVKREIQSAASQSQTDGEGIPGSSGAPGLEEQFAAFYQDRMQELPDARQEAILHRILEQQSRHGTEYVQSVSEIPEEEIQELVELAGEETQEPAAPAGEETQEPAAPAGEETQEPAAPAGEETQKPEELAREEAQKSETPAGE